MTVIQAPGGVAVRGPVGATSADILSPGALAFLAKLHRSFDERRHEMLARRAARHVQLQLDGLEQRLVVRGAHGAVDLQHHRARLGALALQDRRQRLALRGVGALVDDGLHAALAEMDRAGPAVRVYGEQAVQPRVAEVPLIDAPTDDRLAGAVGGQRHELARAAVGAVAGLHLFEFHAPFHVPRQV